MPSRFISRAMVVVLAGLFTVQAAYSQTSPWTEPDYRAEVRRYVPLPLAGKRPDFADRIQNGPLRRFCEETAVLVRLWQWTARAEYAEEARQRLAALVDVWHLQRQPGRPWKRVCFFSAYPILDAYRRLADGGQLDTEFTTRFRQFAREGYYPQEEGAFNQAFARAAGLALAAQTFPDLPEAAGWRKSAEGIWNQWYRQRDTTENAAAYNGISLTFLFLLGDALGKGEQFRDPGVRPMFERFRNQISPRGIVPEYGDSGDAQWGVFHSWGNWIAGLERAAVVYQDPTYRWAAGRMFQAAVGHRGLDSMNSAYALCLADQWRDRRLAARAAEVGSLVARRPEPGNDCAWDKLILVPSRQPGAPFVMAELYARGYHAHDDQIGAVLYYEAGDVPLLDGLGYHNRAAEQADLVLMAPPDEPFPHKAHAVTPGVWHEAALPARRLPPVTPEGKGRQLRHFDKLTFRVAEDAPVELLLRDLRLSGPKGEVVLDDFRLPQSWRGGRQQLVPADGDGRPALKIACRRGTNFIWRAGFDKTFSLADYEQIKFSWKMLGVGQGWSRSLMLRVDASPSDFHVPLRPLAAEVLNARADSRGGDQFGEFQAARWFTDDSRLVRRMLLLREGLLVVCDRLQPGPQADGWLAGPLWHLGRRPRPGENWFNAPGKSELLVWFSPAKGRTCGVADVELWSGAHPFTVFAKEKLRANRPVSFVTVLAPHAPEVPAEKLAAGIRAETEASGAVKLDLRLPSGPLRVRVGNDGSWSVTRGKP